MRHSVPVGRTMRTTWRTDVKEIAAALGIPIGPDQWVVLENAEGEGDQIWAGDVDVVRWERVSIDPEADRINQQGVTS